MSWGMDYAAIWSRAMDYCGCVKCEQARRDLIEDWAKAYPNGEMGIDAEGWVAAAREAIHAPGRLVTSSGQPLLEPR